MTRGRKPGVQPADRHFIRAGALAAPDDLPEPARALWAEVMRSTPEQQWRPGDLPLLAVYCRTHALASEAAARLEAEGQLVDGRPSPWARLLAEHAKVLAGLASKLRLAPSSRIRPDAAGLRTQPAGRAPWEADDDDDLLARPEAWSGRA
jgi:phage terminase small subunit